MQHKYNFGTAQYTKNTGIIRLLKAILASKSKLFSRFRHIIQIKVLVYIACRYIPALLPNKNQTFRNSYQLHPTTNE